MTFLTDLLGVRPAALLGRDPDSLMLDVLDDSAHDGLSEEIDALTVMISARAGTLPMGTARTMTVEMTPLLCSLAMDVREVDQAIAYVHGWISGLGDVPATARMVDGAMQQAKLVFAENPELDIESFTGIHPDDQEAVSLYERMEARTSVEHDMGGWTLKLLVADHRTLAAMMIVGGRRVVIGTASIDQDDGRSRAAPKVPQLAA